MKIVVETRGVKFTVEWDQDVPEAALSLQAFADGFLPAIVPLTTAFGVLGQGVVDRLERLEQIERGERPRST